VPYIFRVGAEQVSSYPTLRKEDPRVALDIEVHLLRRTIPTNSPFTGTYVLNLKNILRNRIILQLYTISDS